MTQIWPLVALPGAQAAIQLLPHLRIRGAARILAPTYNEFEAALTNVGWHVDQVPDVAGLTGANLAVVVNPNNPTGTVFTPEMLSDIARSVDLLVVDESFADATPERSLLSHPTPQNVIVLRSFGKFFWPCRSSPRLCGWPARSHRKNDRGRWSVVRLWTSVGNWRTGVRGHKLAGRNPRPPRHRNRPPRRHCRRR